MGFTITQAQGLRVDNQTIRMAESGEFFDMDVNAAGQLAFKRNGAASDESVIFDDEAVTCWFQSSSGVRTVHYIQGTSDYGSFATYGPNGNINTWLSASGTGDNNGWFGVRDATNVTQAGTFVDGAGDGIVFGDMKNFVMDHPTDEESYIVYASLEGPEAGAYDRGTAKLNNGEVFISYSEVFGIVANPTTITVSLTPLSADTYGLAVIEKNEEGFRVKELKNGTGNFSFDWEIKGQRKGYEGFEDIQPKSKYDSGGPLPPSPNHSNKTGGDGN